jgi:putative ABC transport system substrate-binding protein
MRRRELMAFVGSTALIWPFTTRAQQPAMPVIGFLSGASPQGWAHYVAAFLEGLKESGYVDGQNVIIEYRWAEGEYDRLPAMTAELVHRQVSVIAATSTPASLVAKVATSTIPIVFTTGGDPVQLGLVASLSRPGGNITGVTQLIVELLPKRLELARELVPSATLVALLINARHPRAEIETKDLQAAAVALGLQLRVLRASTDAEIETALATFRQLKADLLVIGGDPFFSGRAGRLASLTLRYSVPAIYQYAEFTAAGGLMSYGGSITDSYHLAGSYTGRILKGEKPAEMPVMQSTKVELIINLKTAKALGLTVPQIE